MGILVRCGIFTWWFVILYIQCFQFTTRTYVENAWNKRTVDKMKKLMVIEMMKEWKVCGDLKEVMRRIRFGTRWTTRGCWHLRSGAGCRSNAYDVLCPPPNFIFKILPWVGGRLDRFAVHTASIVRSKEKQLGRFIVRLIRGHYNYVFVSVS